MKRRTLLGGLAGLGGLVMGGAVAGAIGSVAQAAEDKKDVQKPTPGQVQRFGQQGGDFSWKPNKLDLNEVGEVAHAGFHYKGYG